MPPHPHPHPHALTHPHATIYALLQLPPVHHVAVHVQVKFQVFANIHISPQLPPLQPQDHQLLLPPLSQDPLAHHQDDEIPVACVNAQDVAG